jgi:hypothetical protein
LSNIHQENPYKSKPVLFAPTIVTDNGNVKQATNSNPLRQPYVVAEHGFGLPMKWL